MRSFWNRRGRGAKTAIIVVGVLVVLGIIGGATGTSSSDTAKTQSTSATPAPTTTTKPKPEPKARVQLVAKRSYCQTSPLEARLVVYLTVRNTGAADGEYPDSIPVRRYSDGSTNDSGIDVLSDMKVPAGQTRSYFGEYDYNAQEHELIECGIRHLDDTEPIPLTIRPPKM